MREDFLHYVWRWRRFDGTDLTTTEGQPLTIVQPGILNTDAGPDFFNARVRIGDTEWAGNVEIHINASEWFAHQHHSNPAYDNVVLHVVLNEDRPAQRTDGSRIPCLCLKGRIPADLSARYENLAAALAMPIPCAGSIAEVPGLIQLNWLDRMAVERLEAKTDNIATRLSASENHWETAFYEVLARSFGLKVNAEPFDALARSLPLTILARHKNNLLQLEALLLGQAGLLDGPFEEAYPQALAKEYTFLKHKYQLTPLEGSAWKFLRLRPANFPSLRLAQFAALVHQSAHLFSKILEVAPDLRQLENLFDVTVSDYWLTHYQLDKPSPKRQKNLGRDFVHLLAINTIVPFLFHYGKAKQQPDFQDKALRLLEALPSEANAIIDQWADLGINSKNAYQSQALLQLKNCYCDARRCLYCSIGHNILR
jgi:Protein of unknown function (DUF2851)